MERAAGEVSGGSVWLLRGAYEYVTKKAGSIPENTQILKKKQGRPENVKVAQDALFQRAKSNSFAQFGKYTGEGESEEAKKGIFVHMHGEKAHSCR